MRTRSGRGVGEVACALELGRQAFGERHRFGIAPLEVRELGAPRLHARREARIRVGRRREPFGGIEAHERTRVIALTDGAERAHQMQLDHVGGGALADRSVRRRATSVAP
jgi:hypothetical protein